MSSLLKSFIPLHSFWTFIHRRRSEGSAKTSTRPNSPYTLKNADVNLITIFAKCYHGMACYLREDRHAASKSKLSIFSAK